MTRLSQLFLFFSTALLIGLGGLSGCQSTKEGPNPSPSRAALAGYVFDENFKAVAGATLASGNSNETSDARGYFAFSDAEKQGDRYVVTVSKPGYFSSTVGFKVVDAGTKAQIMLSPKGTGKAFNAGTATTINADSGFKITLPAGITRNGQAFTGTARAFVRYVSPRDQNLGGLMPGLDMAGTSASGQIRQLITYGAARIELTDDAGQPLELTSGAKSTITFPAGGATLAQIPLWHLDEATGMWKEEGVATLINGQYVGEVSHFSAWNLDIGVGQGGLKGIVKDCSGNPASGVPLKVGQQSVTTREDGSFFLSSPAGVPLTISTRWSSGQNSQSMPIAALTEGQLTDIGACSFCVSAISGKVVDCQGVPGPGSVMAFTQDGGLLGGTDLAQDGSFNLSGPPGERLRLLGNLTGQNQTIDSVFTLPDANRPNRNVGSLPTCGSTIDTSINMNTLLTMQITGPVHGGESYRFGEDPNSSAYGGLNADDTLAVIGAGRQLPSGKTVQLSFAFKGNRPGTYVLDGRAGSGGGNASLIYLSGNNPGDAENYTSVPGQNIVLTVTEFGPAGGRIKGSYTGSMVIIRNGVSETIQVSGTFDVIRLQ